MATRLSSMRNIWGNLMHPHPAEPILYFKPFLTTLEPKLNFNEITYYAGDDYFLNMQPILVSIVCNQLIHSLEDETTTFIPDSLMEVVDLDVRAAYYPTLSDLEGYLHNGAPIFARWLCQKSMGVEDAPFIPKDLIPILDRKPIVMTEHIPIYTLPLQERHMFIGAKIAAIHVMEVNAKMKLVKINVFTCKTKFIKIRYHRISVCGSDGHIPQAPNFPKGATFVLWNARNVHRPSFKETFNKLFNAFSPEVVLITEARADAALFGYVRDVLQGLYRVDGFGFVNGYYGVLLIWEKCDVYPWITHRGEGAYCHQVGVAIEPGAKFYSTPQRFHPASTWYEDRGGDEDGVVHSDNDHLSV